MLIDELGESESRQLNIQTPNNPMAASDNGQPARPKKAKKPKQTAPMNNPPQQRYGAKLTQNLFSNYLEGPTNLPAGQTAVGQAKPPKLKKAPPRGNRPIKSAVRNSSRPHHQT